MIFYDTLTLMLTFFWDFFTNPPVFYFIAGLFASSLALVLWEVTNSDFLPRHD